MMIAIENTCVILTADRTDFRFFTGSGGVSIGNLLVFNRMGSRMYTEINDENHEDIKKLMGLLFS